jgi:uncharacterized protein YdeI (YjbR/CyaY-like superfamily)
MVMARAHVRFFASPAEWRRWLVEHHAAGGELWVGFHKRATGKPSLTWPESVDEALCFGWIDGLRKRIDDTSYKIRFTPRRSTSIWSAKNVKRMAELEAEGRMRPAGRATFEARNVARSQLYSYEQRVAAELEPAQARALRANAKAWAYFQARPPWYRRTAVHWVVRAKREETRARRFAQLLADCAAGRTLPVLTPTPKRK